MAFDPDFLSMMASVVTYLPQTSFNGYGESVFGTPQPNIPAHITYKTLVKYADTTNEMESSEQLQMPPGGYRVGGTGVVVPTVLVNDHVILPDANERYVLDVTTYFDESGQPQHQSLLLGKFEVGGE